VKPRVKIMGIGTVGVIAIVAIGVFGPGCLTVSGYFDTEIFTCPTNVVKVFISHPDRIEVGENVPFGVIGYTPGGANVVYKWTFSGEGTAEGSGVKHRFEEATTYTVHLSVSEGGKETASGTVRITVLPEPEPETPTCTEPEVLDAETNTCVIPEPETPTCTEPEVLDAETNTCVTPEPETPTCTEPEVLDIATNTCVIPEPETPTCTEPEVLDAETNTCVIPEPEPELELPIAKISAPTSATVGNVVKFLANGSFDPDGSIVSYAWTFGDGASDSGPNVEHVYSASGPKTVTLTVFDNDGFQDTTSYTINIQAVAPPPSENPIASFTITPPNPQTGDIVTFDASDSYDPDGGFIAQHRWDFGDGSSIEGKIVTHSFSSGGSYSVILTIWDDENQSDSTIKSVSVTKSISYIFGPTCNIVIKGTFTVDLEKCSLGSSSTDDLWWEQVTESERYLAPRHGAQIVNLGKVNFNSIEDPTKYSYSFNEIDGSISSNTIPEGPFPKREFLLVPK